MGPVTFFCVIGKQRHQQVFSLFRNDLAGSGRVIFFVQTCRFQIAGIMAVGVGLADSVGSPALN